MSTNSRRVVAIIQARMGSERLPGKVLALIAGKPMIEHVVDRASMVKSIQKVVVATTTDAADDPIAAWGQEKGHQVFRGHPIDVLDRYYQAAVMSKAEVIVRITGDCPLLDPGVTDQTVSHFLAADPPLDFVANRLPGYRSYPIGLDTEVCSQSALTEAWSEARQPHQREHVMPYLYQEAKYAIGLIGAEADFGHERWTVDTPADLEFARAVFAEFEDRGDFGWTEVLGLLKAKPELREINREVRHRQLEEVDSRYLDTKGRSD